MRISSRSSRRDRTGSHARLYALALAGAASLQCSLLAPSDAELRGAGLRDASADQGAASNDGSTGDDAGDVFNDLRDARLWSSFDTNAWTSTVRDFYGGAFDGRYVYFAPASNGLVARYDTNAALEAADSWSLFDTASLSAKAFGFHGATFDGRYVYFVPHGDRSGSVVARFDTQGSFGDKSAWATFDTNTLSAQAEGFEGATFDGRYLYLVPQLNEAANYDGVFARYDTQQPFSAVGSWRTFDTSPLNTYANGFHGGVFDGRYLYAVPFDPGVPNAVVARFDTSAPLDAASSWEFYSLDNLRSGLSHFFGGAFDGRYVYFAPNAAAATVLRLDTRGAFSVSWIALERPGAAAGERFAGCAFDGRFVYFAPNQGARAIRVDTRGVFSEASSWAGFDVTQIAPAGGAFVGAVFDGQYVYFVPSGTGVVVRFKARPVRASATLPVHFGSFY